MKLVKEHINEFIKARGIFPLRYIPPFEGNINLSGKNITELPKNLPKKITGGFYCHNTKITSLVGALESVGGSFSCYNTKITSLEGAPESVGGDFSCKNTKITSLVGAPESVGRSFDCQNTKVTKEEVERYFETGAVRGTIYSDYGEYKRR